MRLLLVGTAPQTGHLAQSLVFAGSGHVIHCGMEAEALRLVHAGERFDWVLAEVRAAPALAREIRLCTAPPLPGFTFLDWARADAPRSAVSRQPACTRVQGLVDEDESPWVLEYHVPPPRRGKAL